MSRNGFDDGVHQDGRVFGCRMGKEKVFGGGGNDFVAGQLHQKFKIKIVQCVLSVIRRGFHRHDGIIGFFVINKIYRKDACHCQ